MLVADSAVDLQALVEAEARLLVVGAQQRDRAKCTEPVSDVGEIPYLARHLDALLDLAPGIVELPACRQHEPAREALEPDPVASRSSRCVRPICEPVMRQ